MTDLQTARPGAQQDHPLDNAIRASLTGPHAHFAQGHGTVLRYPPDVSPFVALPAAVDEAVWADLARLVGPGQTVALSGPATLMDHLPAGWEISFQAEGVQLVATDALVTGLEPEAVQLGEADADEMLDLVARTQPGPFERRTYQLGTYLGIRRDGALVAMAGERLHPPGFTEISAVCTDASHRGRGLASRLVRAIVDGIWARGEKPFLHLTLENEPARRIYAALGFETRTLPDVVGLRAPD
jgi:predicted GNAT family acetyltransferase